VDSSRFWQTTKRGKSNIFNGLHTSMENIGTEFGFPRRFAPRNDEARGEARVFPVLPIAYPARTHKKTSRQETGWTKTKKKGEEEN
jgi:hypothetical protein